MHDDQLGRIFTDMLKITGIGCLGLIILGTVAFIGLTIASILFPFLWQILINIF